MCSSSLWNWSCACPYAKEKARWKWYWPEQRWAEACNSVWWRCPICMVTSDCSFAWDRQSSAVDWYLVVDDHKGICNCVKTCRRFQSSHQSDNKRKEASSQTIISTICGKHLTTVLYSLSIYKHAISMYYYFIPEFNFHDFIYITIII